MTALRGLVPQLPTRAWVILGGDAVSAVGSGLTLPFFLVYLHQVRGIDLGVAGLILATIAVAGLAGNPLGGWLVDRIGARRTVVAGLIVTAAGTAAIAAVHAAWQGFAAAALYGIGSAVLWPAEDALLATTVDPDHRPHAFAVRHATLNIGFSVGGLLAAAVVAFSSASSFVILYLLDATSFLAFAAIVAQLGDVILGDDEAPNEEASRGYRAVLRDRLFRRLWLLVLLLVAAGYAQYHAAFPVYATDAGGLSASGLAVAFAANTVTVVLVQLVSLRLMAGRRRTRSLMVSTGLTAAAWLTTLLGGLGAVGAGPALFVTAMMLFGLGETLLAPTLPAIVNDLAPDSLRGHYNGAYTLAWTTGYVIGPAIAGLALAGGHGHALFAGMIAALGAVVLATRGLEHRLPRRVNLIAPAPTSAETPEPALLSLAAEGAA